MITAREAYELAVKTAGDQELSTNHVHNDVAYIFYSPVNDITIIDDSPDWVVYKDTVKVEMLNEELKTKLKAMGKFQHEFGLG